VTTLIAAAALLTAVTLGLLLLPLFRGRGRTGGTRAQFDLHVYRDQLAEVDRDARRNLLDREEAEAARAEVKRRMLAALAALEAHEALGAPPLRRQGPARVATAIALVLPTAATLLYLTLGSPDSPDQPLAARGAEQMAAVVRGEEQAGSLEQVVAQLAKKMEGRPDDVRGWLLLGRAYMTLDRFPDAVGALRRAWQLAPDQPDVAGALAEARIAAAGGRVDDEARAALQRVLASDPMSPQARFLLALDRAQQGDLRAAVQGWADLLAVSPADAPWLPVVREHLQRAAQQAGIDPAAIQPSSEARELAAESVTPAPGPSAEDVVAASDMIPEDRAQMIRGMVERLAGRLHDNPDDLEGWRRLARAYQVLGEPDKVREAQAQIDALERR
jgi:cytochrome c-type biogenesis protein CcmH